MIALMLLFVGYLQTKTCKLDFLGAYGLDGEVEPQLRSMLLCNKVKFSCCTVFDELKFHKQWFSRHEPKLQASHAKAVALYTRLAEPVTYFKNFDWTNRESLVQREKLGRTKDILFKLEKIQLNAQLTPIITDMKKLLDFELKTKKSFVCLLCDYNNHEYVDARYGNLMVSQDFCSKLIGVYGPFLQKRAKLLNPVLMLAYKAMGNFESPHFQQNDIESLKSVIRHKRAINKCFPDDASEYSYDNCKQICGKYSASSLSPVFYGEFAFYARFLHRYAKFREWIDSVGEAQAVESEKRPDAVSEKQNNAKPAASSTLASKETIKNNKPAGRVLEERQILDRKMNKISRSLIGYKKIIKNLRRYNNGYLKKIYENSKQLENKSRALGSVNNYLDYGSIYGLYARNLQNVQQIPLQTQQVVLPNQLPSVQTSQIVPQNQVAQQQTVPGTTQQQFLMNSLASQQQAIMPGQPMFNAVNQPQLQQPIDKSIDPNENDIKLGNTNCKNSTDASFCVDSMLVKNSTRVSKSSNVTNSFDIVLSKNISNSFNLFNVTNALNAVNVSDAIRVNATRGSSNLFNVTNCDNCFNVTNSTNCTNCRNCINVHNCTNCENVFNVTEGFALRNVSNSINVTTVGNGAWLINVEDSRNVTHIRNATNMTNAANSTNCKHNFDCAGKACLIPKFNNDAMRMKVKELIRLHSVKIIDTLYALFRTNGLESYKSDPDAFDPQIFRSGSTYNDLDRLEYVFDAEGAQLDTDISGSFTLDSTSVKDAAVNELIVEKNANDIIVVKRKKSDEFRKRLSAMADFDTVYGFTRDMNRGFMSYDSIRNKLDSELLADAEEEKQLADIIINDKDDEDVVKVDNISGEKENSTAVNNKKLSSDIKTITKVESPKAARRLRNQHTSTRLIN